MNDASIESTAIFNQSSPEMKEGSYLTGRKSFSKDPRIISARQLSLLVLESYLLMLDPNDEEEEEKLKLKIESSVKEEAETAAVAWRKRMINEGGIASAMAMDARGLLLLIACFGWKKGFQLLTAYLRMSKESFERAKRKAHSPMAFKEANEKQLAALFSVMQCLETHKLDPAKEYPPAHGQRHPGLFSPPVHEQQQQHIPFRVYRHSPSAERCSGLSTHRSPHK
ncbi:unnamed protein product [Cochlearia groenlandica]